MPDRPAWYVAASSHELQRGPLARVVCDEPLLLFRDARGRVAAQQDRWPHGLCVQSHAAVERDGAVWVWMGDETAAESNALRLFDVANV